MITTMTYEASALEALRAQVRGTVLSPDDTGYAAARSAWNTTIDQYPALIVAAADADDVSAAVKFARTHDLPVAVQATGHGIAYPCDGALLINTANMNGVQIDAPHKQARVEAGAVWYPVLQAARESGLAPLVGFAPYVGVTGYTLGGGAGWLVRKYGLAVDSLRSVEVVLADGTAVRASDDENSDLFWALRGGASNFGIVTALSFALYPVTEVYAGNLFYPLTDAGAVLHAYGRWVTTLPDECTSSATIMSLPPDPRLPESVRGKACVIVRACYLGSAQDGSALLEPLRALAPILDTFAMLPYADCGSITNDPVEPFGAFGHGELLSELTPQAIDELVAVAGDPAFAATLIVELRHLGGAVARVPVDANAISHRDAAFLLHTEGLANTPDQQLSVRGAAQTLFDAMRPYTTGGVMLNFLGDGDAGADRTRAIYSAEHYRRLVELKGRYDPQNVFRFNHNIVPPAVSGT